MNKLVVKAALLVLAAFQLSSCSNSSVEEPKEKPIAKVGSSYLYPSELEYQFEKLVGNSAALIDQKMVRERIRDSLVLSKQMAQKALSSMTEQEKQQLELQVSQYRDEILAKHYINEFVSVEVPTPKAVDQYYQKNLHKFGGGKYVSMVEFTFKDTCAMNIDKNSRYDSEEDVLAMLGKAGCQYSIKRIEKPMAALSKNSPVDSLKTGMFKLQPSSSQIKALYIKAITTKPARPLSEVVPTIRKMLAPVYLKKALKKERLVLSQELEVEFFE